MPTVTHSLPHRIEALQATFSVCAYGIWLVSAQGPRARGQYTMAGGLLGGEAVGYTHRPLGFAQCLPGQAHDSNGLHRELCLYRIYLFYLNEFQYCCSYISLKLFKDPSCYVLLAFIFLLLLTFPFLRTCRADLSSQWWFVAGLVFLSGASGLCFFPLIVVKFWALHVLFGFEIQDLLSTFCLKIFLRYQKFPVVILQLFLFLFFFFFSAHLISHFQLC